MKKQILGRIFSREVENVLVISFIEDGTNKNRRLGVIWFVTDKDSNPFEGRTHYWLTGDNIKHRTFYEARMHLFNQANVAAKSVELVQTSFMHNDTEW